MHMGIWQNFRFTRFFISFTTGNLGDWFDIFALQIIFVHEFNASPILMGLLALFYFLPGVLFGPFSGAIADRFSKRNLMIITDVVSAFLTLGLFLAPNILSALIILVIRSTISSLNLPTQQAYIKNVVPAKNLLQASGYVTVIFQLCKVLGPIVGAVILIYFPARTCIALNIISFVVSALVLTTLPKEKFVPVVGQTPMQIAKKSLLRDIREGGCYIWQHQLIRNLMFIIVVWYACGMIRMSQLAIFLKNLLPNTPNVLGYILGLDGLGAVIAGIFISRRSYIKNYNHYFVLGFCLLGIGTFGLAIYQINWPRFIFYLSPFILGFGSGINGVAQSYILKKESLEHQVGCVYGISSALQNAALATGTILGGLFVMQFGAREVFIGLAVLMFFLSITAFFFLKS